jgi:CDP-paratose 2-epimerase
MKHHHNNGSSGIPGAKANQADLAEQPPVLITGGAGFVGTNLADHFMAQGRRVRVFDNLSRPGVEHNLEWLRETHGNQLEVHIEDIRDGKAVERAVQGVSSVFHFAAQVAVTTSLVDPISDFEINARGTLNLLEALRALSAPPPLVFTSSNKVYGHLADVAIENVGGRYEPADPTVREHGFSEARPLNFHSPYGCSKGAAGQYVLDYARTYGLKAVVFHMSCIYGLHQFGTEDQGWVAHFLVRALANQPITIYGDGRQVRDVLYIADLVRAFDLVSQEMDRLSGESFNIGGGRANTISLLELLAIIEELWGKRPAVECQDWRSADQQYYVSDTRKFAKATGWAPRVGVKEGIKRLYQWLLDSDVSAFASQLNVKSGSRDLPLNSRKRRTLQNFRSEPRSKRLLNAAVGAKL